MYRTTELNREARSARYHTQGTAAGQVYLVGAGPGDPDLLTVRAVRLLASCDVVVHDRLVPRAIVDLAPARAERIDVGKPSGPGEHVQSSINTLLVALARSGLRVLRLKGGDPFIFGRGGEELEALSEAGIHVEVVPGITAALGCAAYAGIPLTHRDCAHACVLVAASLRGEGDEPNWQALAHPGQTLVFYMGLRRASHICERLVAHGLSPHTPAAIVERGTSPSQRVLVATLDTLGARAASAELISPTLIIVGEVVRFRELAVARTNRRVAAELA